MLERTESIQIRGVDVAAIGSNWKLENGVNIDIDTACMLLYQWSNQTVNYNLLRTWAEQTGPVFNYIEEMVGKQGISMVSALSLIHI